MQNTLIDNSEQFRLVNYLNDLINDEKCNEICIATGYWDLKGTKLLFDALNRFFERGGKLRLLIGEEPTVRSYQLQPSNASSEKFPDFYIQKDIDKLTEEYVPVAQMLVDKSSFNESSDDIDSQIQIRVYGQKGEDKKFLHAKCYIFLGEKQAFGIIGSSNFTEKGLQDNAELNHLEINSMMVTATLSQYNDVKSHKVWFDQMWEDESCEDWTGKFIKEILMKAPMAKAIKTKQPKLQIPEEIEPLNPYELYIKLLQSKYGDLVDKSVGKVIESYLPNNDEKNIHYVAYEYQIDAVKECFSTMQEYGGFLLADVVGLGKTIVGTLLIRHFIQYPDNEGRERKVLIITPPAIQSAWKRTIADFDAVSEIRIGDYVEFITTGSIGKLVDDPYAEDVPDSGDFENELTYNNYGLIIIDESHKFRNSETRMYRLLDELIANIGSDTGLYPYVGLLSATPQNNRPEDLKNQIYLFTRNRSNSKFKKANGGNIESYFAEVKREYESLIRRKRTVKEADQFLPEEQLSPEERRARLKELSLRLREDILDYVMIRRTRTDVKKYYAKDMEKQGMRFPDISGPHSLTYIMSPSLAQLFSDTMNMIVPQDMYYFDDPNSIGYYRYRAIQYLLDPEQKEKYAARGSWDADALAERLAKIMQILLVKRLESSFSAFQQSLENLKHYTDNMRKMWENNTIFICPQIDINAELDYKAKSKQRNTRVTFQDCVEEIRRKIAKLNEDGRNKNDSNHEYTRDDFDSSYINLLNSDYEIIADLCERWGKNSEDPKLDEFKDALRHVLFNPSTNKSQKLVIFSEAIDTLDSIIKAAEARGFAGKVLRITADNRDEMEDTIIENFDANYKGEWKNDYQIIVTTDVLAEGINLHRANVILNYDTPWNSTRLMQRIGRVNRIGSKDLYDMVYVYNFMPSSEGDMQIDLVNKAYTKLQSFHVLFGEDNKIFSEDEEIAHYELNTQLVEEESPMEKYLYELKEYKEAHPERYAQIEQATEGLQLATDADGVGYFVVKTPRLVDFYVAVDPKSEDGESISWPEMLLHFKSENTESIDLPINWEAMCKEAVRVVEAELSSIRTERGNSTRATKAKGIIVKLKQTQEMSSKSRKMLNDADKMIRMGNVDMVKCILRIGDAIEQQNMLIPYTQDEFDVYIESNLAKIVEHLHERNGKPEVTMAIYKE